LINVKRLAVLHWIAEANRADSFHIRPGVNRCTGNRTQPISPHEIADSLMLLTTERHTPRG
jgi:hypothetical protein